MTISSASHQDNKTSASYLNNKPLFKENTNKKPVPVVNRFMLQNWVSTSAADGMFYLPLGIYDQAKARNIIFSGRPDQFFPIVSKKPDTSVPDRNTQKGLNTDFVGAPAIGNTELATGHSEAMMSATAGSTPIAEPHADQKYITALLTNNTVVIKELYKNFAPVIRRMVLRNGGSLSDASDLFQDALVIIYRKASAGNFVLTCKLDCYLYKICKNQWLTKVNRENKVFRKVGLEVIEQFSEDHIAIPDSEAVQTQRSDLFWEKFGKLGKSCQELLLLRLSGKSTKEVAKIMKTTDGFVRTKLAKIKKRLTALIDGHDNPEVKTI